MAFSPILLEAHNPGPMTGRGNNTYLLTADDGRAVLVDAGVGHPEHLNALDASLSSAGAVLSTAIVTHGHTDHSSGAPHVAARHPGVVLRKFVLPGASADPVPWTPLHDGDEVALGSERLVILHTPGHAPDHVALWHPPSRSLFVGDLVILGLSVTIDTRVGGDLPQYLASLERLQALNASRLYPAHGPVIYDPTTQLAGYLDHRRMRESQVLAALAAGCDTVEAIADSIYDEAVIPELMWAARENVRAHLLKLKAEGRAIDLNGHWTHG
jgi:glyoxylase-like metal-dependent hydrolase (beta-lactamase superfamily II)